MMERHELLNLKNRFLEFLASYAIGNEYLENLAEGKAPVENRPNTFHEFTDVTPPRDWIYDAFLWDDTESGYEMWEFYAEQWNDYLNRYDIKKGVTKYND